MLTYCDAKSSRIGFFCIVQYQERNKVKDAVFVHYVTDVKVSAHHSAGTCLLLVQAKGYSDDEIPGIPSLISHKEKGEDDPLVLELDFVIHPIENADREHHLEWEVKEVILMDEQHADIKAFKIRAAHNADIEMIQLC